MPSSPRAAPVHPALVLAIAVGAISGAAVLVRLAPEVHPVAAALWRTGAVAALLSPSLTRLAPGTLRGRDMLLVAVGGLLLAAHFWAWFASIHLTTVLRATLLVCLTPVWAGLMEWGALGNRPSGRYWAGIAIALTGVLVMSARGADGGDASWQGDALAIVGGMLSAGYLLIGRTVRQRVAIGPYGALVCGACAVWLLPAAGWMEIPLTGFSDTAWLALAGMAIGPQLTGHIGLNYAVRYLPAATVTAAVLLEPVGAAVLGAAFLGEVPTGIEVIGGLVVLVGVGVATIVRRSPSGAAD